MKYSFIIACLCLLSCGRGPQGLPGTPAPLGPQLPNGTTVTPVQFCPGTTTYPSTFNEVGLCINDTLWAVYSANDGFLTEIPPGTYLSNAIGSSCTFTVLPGCIIQ